MYSVGQVSRAAGVSNTSVRNWSREYEDFLSSGANPPPGQQRQYTHDDLLVFSTIAVLRSQMVDAAAIRQALEDGQRLEPIHQLEDDTAEDDTAEANPRAVAAINALEMALTTQTNRIAILENRIEDMHAKLLQEREEKTAAQTELRVLRELYQDSQQSGRKMSFREWLQSRRR